MGSFFGLEKFKIMVTRNFIIKRFTTLSIFIFVRTSNDLIIYAIIYCLGQLLSQLLMWERVARIISFKKPIIKQVIRHLKPNIIPFLPIV